MSIYVKDMAEKLNLKVFAGTEGLNNKITGGYTSDLLSDVMGSAGENYVWITLQTHRNVMAVASLKDLAAVILVKGYLPDADMLEEGNKLGLPVLGTELQAFEISGLLYSLLKHEAIEVKE